MHLADLLKTLSLAAAAAAAELGRVRVWCLICIMWTCYMRLAWQQLLQLQQD
jgi:hypothetical protein